MIYDNLKYLWPPRPDNVIMPGMLYFYENKKWQAQIKKNGTCTVWFISPDKEITVMNRHNDTHKVWTPNKENSEPFMKLPNKWYVFTGEVLHMKTSHIKDTFYIFDMLVCAGEYLVDKTFKERSNLIFDLFYLDIRDNLIGDNSFKVNEKVWIAQNYDIGFENLYNQLTDIADEGLVLKNPNAALDRCLRQNSNNHWMVKCRKSHKNYGY